MNASSDLAADNWPGTLCAAFIAIYNGIQTAGYWHDIGCAQPFKWAICKKQVGSAVSVDRSVSELG